MTKAKAPYGSIKAVILKACSDPKGIALPDLSALIDRHSTCTLSIMYPLRKAGVIHKAGFQRYARYFTDAAAAQIYQAESERQRDAEAKQKAAILAPLPTDRVKKSKAEKAPKPAKAKKEPVPITISSPKTASIKSTRDATVTWPAHVKVQKAPDFKDTRFTFDPPPGWKGQITADWMDRRLAGA